MNLDYCIPESQRLADLTGISQDLNTAIRYCDLHIEIDPTESGISGEEISRREHTRQALCRAAIVMYGRTFNSGVRTGLREDFVSRLTPASCSLHGLVKDMRDKWVAHAVNHFEDTRVIIMVEEDSEGIFTVSGMHLRSQGIGGFVRAWMLDFRSLCNEVLDLVQKDISNESDALMKFAKSQPIKEIISRPVDNGTVDSGRPLIPSRVRKKFPKVPKSS